MFRHRRHAIDRLNADTCGKPLSQLRHRVAKTPAGNLALEAEPARRRAQCRGVAAAQLHRDDGFG